MEEDKDKPKPWPDNPTEYYWGDWRDNVPKVPCIWDSIPESQKGKVMGLSCPCPKCSTWC